jgi:uncharacterized protein (TIGR03437 family)
MPQAFLPSSCPGFARFLPIPRFALRAAIFFSFVTGAFAQNPLIYSRSVFNAASYMPAGIPAGAIAQGSIFTLFGANLGPSTPAGASVFPFQNTLAGVSLNVIQGATTVPAIPLFVSASQINAIMPSIAPIGTASLQVIFNNARSNMSPVRITSNAMGIFTALGAGLGPGAIENFVSVASQPINTVKVSAKLGQIVTLYGTGLGPITGPDNEPPAAGNLPTKVEVFVGGISAQVAYSGRSPCCAGLDQVTFTVPANAPTGCWVPVYVRTSGTVISNFVSMAITASGGACTNTTSPSISNIFLNGGSLGRAIVGRVNTVEDVGVLAPVTVTADYHLSFAFTIPTSAFPFNPAVTLPPPGACTDYNETGDVTNAHPLPSSLPPNAPLDLGSPLLLTGPNGMKTLTASFNAPFSVRSGQLGGFITNNILPNSLYLSPGSYTVTGMGGTGVGPFSTNFTIPEPLNWTNQSSLGIVPRTQPLTLNWTGGSTGDLDFVIGVGVDLPSNSSSIFVCSVPSGASSFTVPADVLANLPATRPNPLQSKDAIYLLSVQGPSIVNLNASGLTSGATSSYLINGKTVLFQ